MNIIKLCDKRRELKQKNNTTEVAKLYREANQQVKKGTRKAKETWIEEQCQGIEENPTLFNIFLERIMADELEDHEGTISIGGRTITNLRFADDIDGLAGQEQELVKLVNHLEEASTEYGMQISAEKTQLMTNNTNGISTDITIDNKKLETVRSFKYLGAIVSDEGSKPEVLSRIAQTTAAVTKLKVICNDKNITISSKIRLMRSLAMSIFLYACETWTITADIERRI